MSEAKPIKKRRKDEPTAEERLVAINRALPFSLEAEQGVLYCMLQDPVERLPEARATLSPEAFYHPATRTIYETALDMEAHQIPLDPVTLTNRLRETGLLEHIGGAAAVSDLFTFTAIPSHWPHYHKMVREKWLVRDGIAAHAAALENLQQFGGETLDEDVVSVLQKGEAEVFRVLEAASAGKKNGPVHASEVVNDLIEHVLKLQDNKGKILGVSTGIPDLDRAIGGQGLEPGDKFVIGARPKMGKTNLLCTLIKNIAIDQAQPSLVLSMEMAKRRLMARIAFGHFGIETSKASTGFLNRRSDQDNVHLMHRVISQAPLHIDDSTSLSTNDLRSLVRIWKRRAGIKVVFLDYVQLVQPVTKIGTSEERLQIKETMETIHQIARDEQVIFIVLAQAARGAESNPRHEPTAKDFDGGSAVEKFVDYGAFIHRPAKFKRWEDLSEKEQDHFRRVVAPLRARHPENWAPEKEVPVLSDKGNPVLDEAGQPRVERIWDIEQDWDEHALLILCLNRNGDEARIWLRFNKQFTQFLPRNTKLFSNNAAERQPEFEDRYIAPKEPAKGKGKGKKKEDAWHEDFTSDD